MKKKNLLAPGILMAAALAGGLIIGNINARADESEEAGKFIGTIGQIHSQGRFEYNAGESGDDIVLDSNDLKTLNNNNSLNAKKINAVQTTMGAIMKVVEDNHISMEKQTETSAEDTQTDETPTDSDGKDGN